jgi:anti-sigma factor RsiW
MSGADVDLDRLADYAAGLLDPTQAAEVEELIASDPAWADTFAALTAAQPLVRRALADLATPPVPADVVARLDAAFPAAGGADMVRMSVRPARPRRRWARIGVAATAVAAGVAVCVGGLTLVRGHQIGGTPSSNMNAGKAAAPAVSPNVRPAIRASGTDYTPQSVTSVALRADTQGQAPDLAQPSRPRAASEANAVPAELRRLSDPANLQVCLGQLSVAHHGTPTLVDFARYQGRPALVVVLSGTGAGEVVVVGPDCGLPGSGTDQIYATPLR